LAAISYLDRAQSIEPFYELGEIANESPWTRHGVRRSDGKRAIVRVLPSLGTERPLQRVERYLRPLLRVGDVLEVMARTGDLFVIWRSVGDVNLEELEHAAIDAATRSRARELAVEALRHWHRLGMHHGPFRGRGIRFDRNLERCWLVAPALDRVARGLPLPSQQTDQRALRFELDRWLPSESSAAAPDNSREQRFAPAGRTRELRGLLDWKKSPAGSYALVWGATGVGKSSLLRSFADALAEDRTAAVVARPVDALDLGWLGAVLDRLADEVLALPPLVARRAVGQSRAALDMLRPIVAQMSPRWAELLGVEPAQAALQVATENNERSRLQAASALIASCSAQIPVALVLDDVDRAEREVGAFVQALRDAPGNSVKVLASATGRVTAFGADTTIELGPLRGDALVAMVADGLRVDAARARPVAEALDGVLSGMPCDVRSALDSARDHGWLDAAAPRLTAEQARELARATRDPGLVVDILRERGDLWPVFELCALSPRPLKSSELAARAGVNAAAADQAIELARREGALEEQAGRYCLRWSVAEAVRASFDETTARAAHRQIAERLSQAGAPANEIAPHVVRAWGDGGGTEDERRVVVDAGRELLAGYRLVAAEPFVARLRALIDDAAFEDADLEAKARLVIAGWAFLQPEIEDIDGIDAILGVPAGAADVYAAPLHAKAVMLHSLRGDYEAACQTGFAALAELGIEPSGGEARLRALADRADRALPDLPDLPAADEPARVRQELLGALLPATYVARPETFAPVVLELAEQTLDNGTTLDSVRGLTTLAQLACVDLGDSDFGARLGRACLELARRVPGHRYLPIVYSDLANFVMPWSGFLEESYELNRKGRKAAEAMGESQYGGYIRMHDAFNRLALGDRLAPLARRVARYRRNCDHNRMAQQALDSIRDAMNALTAQSAPTEFAQPPGDCPAMVRCIHHLAHALVAMLHRSHDLLNQHSEAAEQTLGATRGWVIPTILCLYLRGIDAHRRDDHAALQRVRLQLQPYARKIDPVAPLTEHLRALELEARGNVHDALAMFQRAINTGIALDFPPMPAFAAEDASLAAGRGGLADASSTFRRRAARYYREWGLAWKARDLEQIAATSAPTRSAATMLLPEGDPEDIAVDVLSELMEQVRANAEAERCELLLYRRTVLQHVLVREAGGATTTRPVGTIDERHLGHAAVNVRRRQSRDNAVAIPLFHGANALVVYLRGAGTSEQAAIEAVQAATAPLKVWMDVWSVQLENLDVQRVTLSLVDALGSHGFLVGFDGRVRTLDGTEYRVPTEVAAATELAIRTGELQRLELAWPPDDQQRICRLTVVPCPELATVRGDVEPALWFAEDVTEAKLAERGAAAERELALFRKLAGGLAHDLSNKLVLMSVLATRGSDDPDFTQAAREAFDAGRRLLARMTKLTTDGAVRPAPAALDLRRHLEGSAAIYSWVLDAGIDFRVELPDTSVMAIAEPGSVDRIVLNLIINAKQALAEGRGQISLRLHAPADGLVRLEVADTGQGIPPAIAERVFDAGVSSKRSSGLGLNVVRDEASACDARLSVDSRVGVGTTFRIEFHAVDSDAAA